MSWEAHRFFSSLFSGKVITLPQNRAHPQCLPLQKCSGGSLCFRSHVKLGNTDVSNVAIALSQLNVSQNPLQSAGMAEHIVFTWLDESMETEFSKGRIV